MACYITTGITSSDDSCNGEFGGLLRVWIANKAQIGSIEKDANNVITGITMLSSAKFYEFQYDDNIGAGLDEVLQADAGGFVLQTLNFTLRKIDQTKKNILSTMKRGKFVAIVEEPDGTLKFAGETGKGLRPRQLDITRGQAPTDLAGAPISLEGQVLDYADSVSPSLLSSIVA